MRSSHVMAVAAAVVAFSSRMQGQVPQGVPSLGAQSRVRVWAVSPAMSGQDAVVVAMIADTLHLVIRERSERVPLAAVSRLEVRTRPRGGHKWAGFLGGALIGGIIGYTSFRPSAAICDFNCDLRPLNAAFGGLVGGVSGLVLGAFLPPAKWERVR